MPRSERRISAPIVIVEGLRDRRQGERAFARAFRSMSVLVCSLVVDVCCLRVCLPLRCFLVFLVGTAQREPMSQRPKKCAHPATCFSVHPCSGIYVRVRVPAASMVVFTQACSKGRRQAGGCRRVSERFSVAPSSYAACPGTKRPPHALASFIFHWPRPFLFLSCGTQ